MKKLILLVLMILIPTVTMARTVEVENFVITTEGEFKTVCTKDRSDCKCFIIVSSKKTTDALASWMNCLYK